MVADDQESYTQSVIHTRTATTTEVENWGISVSTSGGSLDDGDSQRGLASGTEMELLSKGGQGSEAPAVTAPSSQSYKSNSTTESRDKVTLVDVSTSSTHLLTVGTPIPGWEAPEEDPEGDQRGQDVLIPFVSLSLCLPPRGPGLSCPGCGDRLGWLSVEDLIGETTMGDDRGNSN